MTSARIRALSAKFRNRGTFPSPFSFRKETNVNIVEAAKGFSLRTQGGVSDCGLICAPKRYGCASTNYRTDIALQE